MDYLKKLTAQELIDELEKRENVRKIEIGPYCGYKIKGRYRNKDIKEYAQVLIIKD